MNTHLWTSTKSNQNKNAHKINDRGPPYIGINCYTLLGKGDPHPRKKTRCWSPYIYIILYCICLHASVMPKTNHNSDPLSCNSCKMISKSHFKLSIKCFDPNENGLRFKFTN